MTIEINEQIFPPSPLPLSLTPPPPTFPLFRRPLFRESGSVGRFKREKKAVTVKKRCFSKQIIASEPRLHLPLFSVIVVLALQKVF